MSGQGHAGGGGLGSTTAALAGTRGGDVTGPLPGCGGGGGGGGLIRLLAPTGGTLIAPGSTITPPGS